MIDKIAGQCNGVSRFEKKYILEDNGIHHLYGFFHKTDIFFRTVQHYSTYQFRSEAYDLLFWIWTLYAVQ